MRLCKSALVLETDVVVVGGGPSGATTALLLARRGHRVVLVDRARFPRDKACGEGLMPPGVAVVRRLGLYDQVMASGARPLDGVSYQQEGGHPSAYAEFPAPRPGAPAAALGIRRTTFDAVLVDALRREPNARLLEGERVTGLVRNASNETVGVAIDGAGSRRVATGGDEIRAHVVVGADGLHSGVRSWAGLARPAPVQGRYGLAGHWRRDVRDRHAITVTFCAGHEWYEAPVGPELLLVSVLTRRSRTPINAKTYETAARSAVPALGDAELVAGPLGAAQFRQRARTVGDGRVFLVGDAAGYDDPTTGEGLAIGMLLAERLAQHLDDLLSARTSPAEAARQYRIDHARLIRERRRLTQLALLMARIPWLSRRAIAHAASDPTTLSKLLAINCGYQTFAELAPRDWLSLAGI
jgi:2-polyprenyl-6-methoxyphenol hydroxylase-like FAD-dependent oxidoreductase